MTCTARWLATHVPTLDLCDLVSKLGRLSLGLGHRSLGHLQRERNEASQLHPCRNLQTSTEVRATHPLLLDRQRRLLARDPNRRVPLVDLAPQIPQLGHMLDRIRPGLFERVFGRLLAVTEVDEAHLEAVLLLLPRRAGKRLVVKLELERLLLSLERPIVVAKLRDLLDMGSVLGCNEKPGGRMVASACRLRCVRAL